MTASEIREVWLERCWWPEAEHQNMYVLRIYLYCFASPAVFSVRYSSMRIYTPYIYSELLCMIWKRRYLPSGISWQRSDRPGILDTAPAMSYIRQGRTACSRYLHFQYPSLLWIIHNHYILCNSCAEYYVLILRILGLSMYACRSQPRQG